MEKEYDTLYSAKLGCYKLKENAKLPTKGSEDAACYEGETVQRPCFLSVRSP